MSHGQFSRENHAFFDYSLAHGTHYAHFGSHV